jgi:DNA helicase-2/ATP-dependent DNA helicase PcrA
MLCAFSKRIADELTRRLKNPRAQARTLHSLGFSIARRWWPELKVDEERGYRLARHAWSEFNEMPLDMGPNDVVRMIARLASAVKNAAPFLVSSDIGDEQIKTCVDLAYQRNLLPEDEWGDEIAVEDLAEMALAAVKNARGRDGTLDYDDMMYLPVSSGWVQAMFDLVVVDEAQDMSPVQLYLARKVAMGRIAVVGDEYQAIFAWRGAEQNGMYRMRRELKATTLPLTITYRCPRKVVEIASELVGDFTAAPEAPEGTVYRFEDDDAMFKLAEPGDFVLSRTNAPLAGLCLGWLREGRPARIEGRDFRESMKSTIRRMKVRSIDDLMLRLEIWKNKEVAKLKAKDNSWVYEDRVQYLEDLVETISVLTDGLLNVEELNARIDEIFGGKDTPSIVLSTVHRAKGLESDRVFLMQKTLYCNGRRSGMDQEERNIHYVGITRAKDTLVLVGELKTKEDRDRNRDVAPGAAGSGVTR